MGLAFGKIFDRNPALVSLFGIRPHIGEVEIVLAVSDFSI